SPGHILPLVFHEDGSGVTLLYIILSPEFRRDDILQNLLFENFSKKKDLRPGHHPLPFVQWCCMWEPDCADRLPYLPVSREKNLTYVPDKNLYLQTSR